MRVKIVKSAAGIGWHVNENERLNLGDGFARQLIQDGIAVPEDVPESEMVVHKRNAMRPAPLAKTKG